MSIRILTILTFVLIATLQIKLIHDLSGLSLNPHPEECINVFFSFIHVRATIPTGLQHKQKLRNQYEVSTKVADSSIGSFQQPLQQPHQYQRPIVHAVPHCPQTTAPLAHPAPSSAHHQSTSEGNYSQLGFSGTSAGAKFKIQLQVTEHCK